MFQMITAGIITIIVVLLVSVWSIAMAIVLTPVAIVECVVDAIRNRKGQRDPLGLEV